MILVESVSDVSDGYEIFIFIYVKYHLLHEIISGNVFIGIINPNGIFSNGILMRIKKSVVLHCGGSFFESSIA